jgi:hypothetical protein
MCQFELLEVSFLGIVLTPEGVGMEPGHISTIKYWPTPKSITEVQVLFRFMNIYRRFIRKSA